MVKIRRWRRPLLLSMLPHLSLSVRQWWPCPFLCGEMEREGNDPGTYTRHDGGPYGQDIIEEFSLPAITAFCYGVCVSHDIEDKSDIWATRHSGVVKQACGVSFREVPRGQCIKAMVRASRTQLSGRARVRASLGRWRCSWAEGKDLA